MPSSERIVPVEALREAARSYAEATSQRQAAREIGLSGTGFRAFVDGTDPHPATVRKLTEWYVQRQAAAGDVSADAGLAALSLLVTHLPPGERADAARRVAEFVSTLRSGGTAPLPEWLVRAASRP